MREIISGVDELDVVAAASGRPVRPALPWLLLPFCALEGSLAAAYILCGAPELYPFEKQDVIVVGLALACVAAALGAIFAVQRKSTGATMLLGTVFIGCAGALLGLAYWTGIVEAGYELQNASNAPLVIRATSDAHASTQSSYSDVRITLASGKSPLVRVYWAGDQVPLLNGQSATARVSAKPLEQKNSWLAMSGISATASLTEIAGAGFASDFLGGVSARRAINSELIAQVGSQGAALVQGMVLGDSRALDDTDTARNFKVTGLMHLIAVSGSHLAVIAALLGWSLDRTNANRWLKTLLLVLLLGTYVVLTGLQPSAIRSAIMAAVGGLSFAVGRRRHTPSLLCAAGIAMLLTDPSNCFSLGFWLSVFAVLGISLFYTLVAWLLAFQKLAWQHRSLKVLVAQANKYIMQPTALTLVAQAGTLPLSAAFFGIVSLISPLANLLAAPFATVIVGGGIFALTLNQFSDPLAAPVITVVCLIADGMIILVNWLATAPVVATPIAAGLPLAITATLIGGSALYIFWHSISKKLCLCLMAIVLAASFGGTIWQQGAQEPQLVMMDVGQGDALLVRDGSSTILIDTGPSDTDLIKALARQGVRHLSAVVLTHLDDDHCGALDALPGVVSADQVYIANGLLQSPRASTVRANARKLTGGYDAATLQCGDVFTISATLTAQVVWPAAPAIDGENAESICLLLRYDFDADGEPEFQSLLMGDAEHEELEQIIASNKISDVAVVKVGHHGSADAITTEQMQTLRSRVALISNGRNNRYRHPALSTLESLELAQMQIFRTDLLGDITVHFRPDGLNVSYTG